jgi:AraC-like DNA-binding protein
MLIGFKRQFASLVEQYLRGDKEGKNQTVRAERKDGKVPKIGEILYFYTDLCKPSCRKLGEGVCTEVFKIQITTIIEGIPQIKINGFPINNTIHSASDIAKRDGFTSPLNFADWFKFNYGLPFTGNLIRWESNVILVSYQI